MRPQVRALRNAAAQVCQSLSFPFRVFMSDRGLEEILEEADAGDWPVKRIAAETLARCCVEGGRFNNFQVGFMAVVSYLNDQLGRLGQGEVQALRDLVAVLNNNATVASITGWMDTHYR